MVSEQTHKNLNALMHKLNVTSYMFSGMAAAFRKAGHNGCAAFASWEADERWKYAKELRGCIEKFGLTVAMPAIQEAKMDYASPVEAITAMQNLDLSILKVIDAAVKASTVIGTASEQYAAKEMVCIYGKVLHDYNEVSGVGRKIQTAVNDPAAILKINEWLMEKYGDSD